MAIPTALITALAPIVSRLVNLKKPLSATNVSTGVGSTIIGASAMLISSADPTAQLVGYLLGAFGIYIATHKDKND